MTKRSYPITLLAAIGSLIAFAPAATAKPPASITVGQEAREKLQEMERVAVRAEGEANQLEMLSRNSKTEPDAHLDQLWGLKQDINTIGHEIEGLQAQRESLEPWEQQAIDRVLPMLNEAAASTQWATTYFNANRPRLWSAGYRASVEKIRHDSDEMASTLKTYLKYEKVREEEQQLQTTLEAGGN